MARRRRTKDEKRLVIKIHQVTTPDSERRLSRAIDILLRSPMEDLGRSINTEKEGEPPQDSRPEGVAGQSDEGKV